MNFQKSNALKVLALAGSPRREGNTDLLLEKAIEGASSEHTEVIKLVLSTLCIAPCRHCDGCLPTGRCVVEDDAQKVHTLLRTADRIILASPIFFMSVTAQTKAMIDRCQALWVLKYVLKIPVPHNTNIKRKGLFISVGGTRSTKLFEPALETVKVFFRILDCSLDGQVTFRHIDEKGAILSHPTALQEAFQAGQKLVEPPWQTKEIVMAKDPVCGMDVDEKKAAATSNYQGKTYYFCAKASKIAFAKQPEKYLAKGKG